VALIGARNLDPPELEYIEARGVATGAERITDALDGTAGVYVAFDADAVEPAELDVFMPEPAGLTLGRCEEILRDVAGRAPVFGLGFTGLRRSERNVAPLTALAGALGL
jgi:arginase family enzyme